jgi:hypothetical protein
VYGVARKAAPSAVGKRQSWKGQRTPNEASQGAAQGAPGVKQVPGRGLFLLLRYGLFVRKRVVTSNKEAAQVFPQQGKAAQPADPAQEVKESGTGAKGIRGSKEAPPALPPLGKEDRIAASSQVAREPSLRTQEAAEPTEQEPELQANQAHSTGPLDNGRYPGEEVGQGRPGQRRPREGRRVP